MTRVLAVLLTLAVALTATPALAQDTLEKIKSSGTLVIGTRTGSPPFAYVNKDNQWVGFSIDLVEMLVKPEIEKAVGKPIKVEKKESTPPTRIPLLSSN
ncbi:MAG TPA: transporter substrate-binding domain-containing protein, partial [Candidatus Acidoferrum sp.]|nr:transporter substrate-binding domain-containing protein [Candidatus Acidoferrum sp.]